jgi:hypothetical protein
MLNRAILTSDNLGPGFFESRLIVRAEISYRPTRRVYGLVALLRRLRVALLRRFLSLCLVRTVFEK